MWPGLEDVPAKEAGIAGFITFLLAWGLRTVLRVRAEFRGDRAGERIDDAGQAQAEAYRAIIADQEAHIARLDDRLAAAEARANVLDEHLKSARIRIGDEVNRRYISESTQRRLESDLLEAQSLAVAQGAQIADLELRVAELQAARGMEMP